ncbi:MAG: hypothetical protein P8104_05080, partial [Gammaproteobacteria bacterium]
MLGAIFSISATADLAQIPLFLKNTYDPNILLNISVESPVSAAGYNDFKQGTLCGGKEETETVGVCYDKEQPYLGYFDSNKCYAYTSDLGGYFYPVALTNEKHQCSKQFSGNFMNWATMLAINSFTYSLTGGDRIVDEAGSASSSTIISRGFVQDTLRYLKIIKRISKIESDYSIEDNKRFKLDPSTVTPWSSDRLYVLNPMGTNRVRFGTSPKSGDLSTGTYGGDMRVNIKVCDPTVIPNDLKHSLEPNCVAYSDGNIVWYKPEGLVQKYQDRARFGVISLTLHSGYRGGILRSNMKYIGEKQVTNSGNVATNPGYEIAPNGTYRFDPDQRVGNNEYFNVRDSGVINFINKFDDNGYRNHDPVANVYYESLRYFKHNGSTTEYFPSTTPSTSTGFPFLRGSEWHDPIQSQCQKNIILSIGDGYQWGGTRLPGTHYTSRTYKNLTMPYGDLGTPSDADTSINVTDLTNRVGQLEGLDGKVMNVYCTSTSVNCGYAEQIVTNLAETFLSQRRETHYLSGLSYYGNTFDVRPDLPNTQHVKHFVVDVIENKENYEKHNAFNPLWLSGKYGFFDDKNNDGIPQLSEWDSNDDGLPDGYVAADRPQHMFLGLLNAMEFIVQTEYRAFSTLGVAPDASLADSFILYQS